MLFAAHFAFSTFGVPIGSVAILLLPLLLFLLINPKRALLFVWCALAFLPMLLREYFGSFAYNVVNEGVIVLLWLAWIARFLIDGSLRGVPAPLARLGGLVFLVSLVSMIANRTNPVYWLEWVFTYLLPIPVLGISRLYLKDYSHQRLLRIIVRFLLFQMLLNMTWHAGINPLRNSHLWVDSSCGTYGNTATTAYIVVAVITGGILYFSSARMHAWRWLKAVSLMAMAAIQLFFTYTTHAYVLLPLSMLSSFHFVVKSRSRGLSKGIVSVLVIIVVAVLVTLPLLQSSVGTWHYVIRGSGSEYANRTWLAVWQGPKISVIRRVLQQASPIQILIGMGPNSAVSYTGYLLNSQQTHRLIGEWFNTISGREALSTGSIRENIFSGIAMLLSETGLIGMVLYLALLIYPLWYIAKNPHAYRESEPESMFLVGSVFMLLLMNVIIGMFWDVWRIRMLSISLWLLLGRIWDEANIEKESLTETDQLEIH